MTGATRYVENGWGELNGALIFCPSQVPLPIRADTLITAAEARWPGKTKTYPPTCHDKSTSIEIFGEEPAPFFVNLFEGNLLISVDGTPEQNVVAAAWLRSLMPQDAPRMVVGDKGFGVHAELPFGVTPDQIASTMIRHDSDDWNADDPDLQW